MLFYHNNNTRRTVESCSRVRASQCRHRPPPPSPRRLCHVRYNAVAPADNGTRIVIVRQTMGLITARATLPPNHVVRARIENVSDRSAPENSPRITHTARLNSSRSRHEQRVPPVRLTLRAWYKVWRACVPPDLSSGLESWSVAKKRNTICSRKLVAWRGERSAMELRLVFGSY